VLINTHYLAEKVEHYVVSSPWKERVTLTYEERLLGTGGTILRNRDFFGRDAFMVVHADNLSDLDVPSFIGAHRSRPPGSVITMMTFDTDAPQTCGIVVTDGRGVVLHMHEKVAAPPGRRANGAVYIFEPEVVDFMASIGKANVDVSTEVLPHFMGRIFAFHNQRYHRDIGTIESLRKAEIEFARR